MTVRSEVRDAQRDLAALDAAHTKATSRLETTRSKRAEIIADADRQVEAAQVVVDQAVADMAHRLSPDLAARLCGLDLTEVRRLAKTYPPAKTENRGATTSKSVK